MQFDYRESTITYDYELRIVEFYFTKSSNYETCKKRNPHFIVAEDLKPGYRLVYPFNQVRTPEYLLRTPPVAAKPHPGLVANASKAVNSGDSETRKAC